MNSPTVYEREEFFKEFAFVESKKPPSAPTDTAKSPLSGLAGSVSRLVDRILTPNQVVERCRYLAQALGLEHRALGESERGFAIDAYEVGEGAAVLLYGLPDPGEAVGATLIVALLEALAVPGSQLAELPLRWHVIPCLNHDDQPDGGASLRPTRKVPSQREVDWCLDSPRPETRALLAYAARCRPVLTGALHDEFHDGGPLPAYVATSRLLSGETATAIAGHLARLHIPLDTSVEHPTMGAGFFIMSDVASDYARSTFSVLEQYGLVVVGEVARYADVPPAALVEAQMAVLLEALGEVLAPVGEPLAGQRGA